MCVSLIWRTKNHTFGGRAGPSYNIDNIFHEIAHAIEFIKSGYSAEDRALYGSFQFIVKYHEFFQRCIDVQTNQITMREVKTFAIQLALMKQLGWKFDSLSWINSHVELLVWLPDFLNISSGAFSPF
jgi:hypothetical protein